MLELTPVVSDYVYQVGGADARDLFDKSMEGAAETGNAALENGKTWFEMTLEEKKEEWVPALPWWALPTRSALDRATATVPRVLNDRMDELGLDYAVLYTTTGLAFDRIEPQEQRLIVCRAINAYAADLYRPYSHRMTPAAIVPMDTPEIAIQEMEYAVNELGLKVIMLPGRVERPIAKYRDEYPGAGEYVRKMGRDRAGQRLRLRSVLEAVPGAEDSARVPRERRRLGRRERIQLRFQSPELVCICPRDVLQGRCSLAG